MFRAILVCLLLAGCAGPTAIIRVIDYEGGGFYGTFTGEAGGCAVHQTARVEGQLDMTIALTYKGKNCTVDAKSK